MTAALPDGATVPADNVVPLPDAPARPGPAAAPEPARSLVIKTTSGLDRPEACNQAFTVAAAALAAGAGVSLWLTGESAWFALPGRAADLVLEHAVPLPDLLEAVLAEGTVTLCTQCAARRGITGQDVLPGVRIAGAAVFAEECLRPGAQALVY